jgi:hypothetical protein
LAISNEEEEYTQRQEDPAALENGQKTTFSSDPSLF